MTRKAYVSVIVALSGVYILYAALAHHPFPQCTTLEEIVVDGGVHFGSDLALRYCKVGTDPCCKPYDGAMRVFWAVTTLGVGLVGGGAFGLRRAGIGAHFGRGR
jgi:hypothetical protein